MDATKPVHTFLGVTGLPTDIKAVLDGLALAQAETTAGGRKASLWRLGRPSVTTRSILPEPPKRANCETNPFCRLAEKAKLRNKPIFQARPGGQDGIRNVQR